jgi:hypothetical protein
MITKLITPITCNIAPTLMNRVPKSVSSASKVVVSSEPKIATNP